MAKFCQRRHMYIVGQVRTHSGIFFLSAYPINIIFENDGNYEKKQKIHAYLVLILFPDSFQSSNKSFVTHHNGTEYR